MAALTQPQVLARVGMLAGMSDDTPRNESNLPLIPFTPENMKARRKELGLNQTQLGEKLQPPAVQNVITRWENGKHAVQGPRRAQIASILGLQLVTDQPGNVHQLPSALADTPGYERMVLLQIKAIVDDALANRK